MNDVIKQGFIDCEKFIDEHTPEELQEYEKSLNLDYKSYYRTPEQVIEDLSSMQDVSSKSIKESFHKVRYNAEEECVFTLTPVNTQDENEFEGMCFRNKASIVDYCKSLDDVTAAHIHEEFDYYLIVCWKNQEESDVGYSISDYYINEIKLI